MLGSVAGVGLAKLLPDAILGVLFCVFFVESYNVDNGLGIPFLFLLRDTSTGQDILPFARETLVGLVIGSGGEIETRNNLQ
jgi:hypothetical protein